MVLSMFIVCAFDVPGPVLAKVGYCSGRLLLVSATASALVNTVRRNGSLLLSSRKVVVVKRSSAAELSF